MKENSKHIYNFGSDVYDFYPNGIGEVPQLPFKVTRLKGESYKLRGIIGPRVSQRVRNELREIGTRYAIAQLGPKGEVTIWGSEDWRVLPNLDITHSVRRLNVNGKKRK